MRVLLVLFLILSGAVSAQKTKSDSVFQFTYFKKSGKIATKRLLYSENIRFGYAKAYNEQGVEIYSMSTRNVGGHASVDFQFYESGAVRSAHYTSQPDGGIQRGDVRHRFDETGKVIEVIDLSDDGFGRTVTRPILRFETPNTPAPAKPEIAVCAEIYSTEIYLLNLTRKKVVVTVTKQPVNGQYFKTDYHLNPGDSILAGTYIGAQLFVPASSVFNVQISEKRPNRKNRFHTVWDQFLQPSPALRQERLLLIQR